LISKNSRKEVIFLKRKHLIVHGRVQGVGFRFFASSIAHKYNLTGYVKNEYDGTVVIEAQGAPYRIEAFIQEIKEGNRFIRVDFIDITDMPLKERETTFRTRY